MEPSTLITLIGIAFASGMAINAIGLPPMVGFLLAGFVLNAMGFESSEGLSTIADLGVTLLLFSIGLKLDIRTLFKSEVWGAASLHITGSVLFFAGALFLLKFLGLGLVESLDSNGFFIVAFALSFSSTVFAVKILEEKSEMNSLYGRIAIGVLIMQDIFAVLFLTFSTGKLPEYYALGLLLLPFLRPLLFKVMDKVGHGELLVLYGFFLALVIGAGLFEMVGMKADLGALIAGMLVAAHPSAGGMAKSLFNLKELFLVCFFLNIGLNGLPTGDHLIIAALLVLLLPLKTILYFFCFNLFKLRARTSLLGSFSLANYSEFGLIVAALAASKGWLSNDWLIVTAIALSFSFILASVLNKSSDAIYQKLSPRLKRFQHLRLHVEDRPIRVGDAKVLVMGMGRIGTGAYDELKEVFGDTVLGIDNSHEKTIKHRELGRRVITGDAMDSDFWNKLEITDQINLILLAMPDHNGNHYAAIQLRNRNCSMKIAAIARFAEDIEELKGLGVNAVFNMYDEAGAGFARHVCSEMQSMTTPVASRIDI
ncbi:MULTISPECIES: cation:proton antiporter family protein [unclassified Motilimonas]|uniref:cation:proton antiporter family protein n=1 Tax=Motilimonas TaxID=1914248 RepID=UPI001E467FE1|nr:MULTISPECIES: cation:proton antiporter family protein [unclassified Motilimonas]MCE0556914.1 cation:proton antiporter [Motilimonas sp. E26]MDO6525535.1 cation:proton antiporter [Motilimonas sp. 1_MG-2023]